MDPSLRCLSMSFRYLANNSVYLSSSLMSGLYITSSVNITFVLSAVFNTSTSSLPDIVIRTPSSAFNLVWFLDLPPSSGCYSNSGFYCCRTCCICFHRSNLWFNILGTNFTLPFSQKCLIIDCFTSNLDCCYFWS